MQKHTTLFAAAFTFFALCFGACHQKKTETADSRTESAQSPPKQDEASGQKHCTYTYDSNQTSLSWTAYKTSEKVGVGGKFTDFEVTPNAQTAKTPEDFLKNLRFSISAKSIDTMNPERDTKIFAFFFTPFAAETIEGEILEVENGKATLNLTMNGQTQKVTLNYTLSEGKKVQLTGNIDLLNWNGSHAIKMLNDACYDLHKGVDGKSKLWSEVGIAVTSELKENCD